MDQVEEFRVKGDELLGKIRELIREGNVRQVTIKSSDGRTMLEIPLTIGVVGALIAPVPAAIGAVTALVTECTVTITRDAAAAAEPERAEAEESGEEESGEEEPGAEEPGAKKPTTAASPIVSNGPIASESFPIAYSTSES